MTAARQKLEAEDRKAPSLFLSSFLSMAGISAYVLGNVDGCSSSLLNFAIVLFKPSV